MPSYLCSAPPLVTWKEPKVWLATLLDPDSIRFAYITWEFYVDCSVGGCREGDGACHSSGNRSVTDILLLKKSAIRGPMTGAQARAVGACIQSGVASPAECLALYGGGATAKDVIDKNDVEKTRPKTDHICRCLERNTPSLSQLELNIEGAKANEERLRAFIKRDLANADYSPIVFK